MITNELKIQLFDKAKTMLNFSYAPYSHFHVGAALLTKDGNIYTGCNIENAAYGPSNCAERTAFFKAVSEGILKFDAIMVGGVPNGKIKDYCPPCGVCRQVMMEFAPELTVICLNKKGESKKFALKELLPYGFDQTWL